MARKYDPARFKYYRFVEIKPEFVGTAGFNIKPYSISSPRLLMVSSQMGQKPAILHGQPARLFTGFEREHGKNLRLIRMPCDGVVKEVLHKYGNYLPEGQNAPITLVVFERMDNGAIDVIRLPHNRCTHQTFGFRYIWTETMNNIYPGMPIEKDTILAKPITLNDDGDWCYGINVRMGLLQSEEGIEDGLGMSASCAKRFAMYGYGTIETSFGKDSILLNAHGKDGAYKPWLNLGEHIPETGIITSVRDYDPDLAPANMSRAALQRVNQTDDTKFGIPVDGKIVDIRIIKGNPQTSNLPPEIEGWVDRYWDRTQSFHNSILNTHKHFKKNYRSNEYKVMPRWSSLVKEAMDVVNAKQGAKKETYRGASLEDTLLQIQYEYIYIPRHGTKFTCRQAGKAVACRIIPDHLMPVDEDGVPLDVIMDDISATDRMNTPRLDEVLITSCAERCVRYMRAAYEEDGDLLKAWNILHSFYEIISPPMMEEMEEITDIDDIRDEIEWVLLPPEEVPEHYISGIRVALPSDLPLDWVKALPVLAEKFPPIKSKIGFPQKDGTIIYTRKETIIGEVCLFPLERAAQGFAATSSARRQSHGIPVKPSKAEKSSAPINDSPTRGDGEDETRGISAILGGMSMADVYDENLSPPAHQQVCRSIYGAANPARITKVVPRTVEQIDPTVIGQKVIPFTGGRVVEGRDHILFCGGIAFAEGEDGDAI